MPCTTRNNTFPPAICSTAGGACEKACVDVKKVFDACLSQSSVTETLQVDFGGGDPTGYTVSSLTSSGDAVLSDVVVTPIAGSPCSRVSYTATVPVTVVATNAVGTQISGTSSMTLQKDIILRVPSDGVIAPTIDATVVIEGLQNTLAGTEVTTTACVTVITKVVADVILVIPTYGYPTLPPCQEYTQDVCSGVFGAPVFPR